MAKLEADPRLVDGKGLFRSTVEYGRRIAMAFNPLWDAVGLTPRQGATSLSDVADGPAFSAYLPADQDWTSGNFQQLTLSAEEFDTSNCFDTSTARFTPNVPGYYLIVGQVTLQSTTGANCANSQGHIYKNGVGYRRGDIQTIGIPVVSHSIEALVPMNGSTDYLTLAAFLAVSAGNSRAAGVAGGVIQTWMAGHYARRL